MTNEALIQALNRLKVQTGSLACLGCGYEHNCTTKGCRILREAAEQLCRGSCSEKRGGRNEFEGSAHRSHCDRWRPGSL